MIPRLYTPCIAIIMVAAVSMPLTALAQDPIDAAAASKIFKDNDCHKCHHAEKAKKGPALKKTAAKYREKKLDENEAIKHMTSGKKVKLEDGTEEDHKIIDTKDPKVLSNVARWILSH